MEHANHNAPTLAQIGRGTPRSQIEGSTYLRLGPELKEEARIKAARERVPGGLSGAVKRLVEMWTRGEVGIDLE